MMSALAANNSVPTIQLQPKSPCQQAAENEFFNSVDQAREQNAITAGKGIRLHVAGRMHWITCSSIISTASHALV